VAAMCKQAYQFGADKARAADNKDFHVPLLN